MSVLGCGFVASVIVEAGLCRLDVLLDRLLESVGEKLGPWLIA